MQPNIFTITMRNGLLLGILFSVNFLLGTSKNLALVMLTYLVLALIIYLSYRTAKSYREHHLGGYMRFWQGFNFIVMSFFFAGIISAIFKMIYTRYLNPDFLPALFEQSMQQMETNRALFESFNITMDEAYIDQVERQFKPTAYALQSIWINVFFGVILGLLLSGFVQKKKGLFDDDKPATPNDSSSEPTNK